MTDRHHTGEDRDDPALNDVVSDADSIDAADGVLDELHAATPEDQDVQEYPPGAVGASACRFCQERFDTLGGERSHSCDGRRHLDHLEDLNDELVAPQLHEVGAQWLFDRHGLDPYFAIVSNFDRCLQDDGADDIGTFEAAGDTWRLNHDEDKVKYWVGKIATRDGDAGDAFYEYNVGVVAEDSVGRKRVNFQFRPALPNATHVETGEQIGSLPPDLPEGVRAQVDGANVALENYIDVFRALMRAMDVNPGYFQEANLHEWSRCYNQAPYVRLDRRLSERHIVPRDGLLDRLSSHAAQQRGKGRYEWDNEEIVGHRNTVAMNAENLQAFIPDQTVGKLLKSYHMKQPEQSADSVTAHPKLEVQYSTEFSFGDFESVPWRDPEGFDAYDLQEELVEWLLNCLDWAGITLAPGEDVYVTDEYFAVDSLDEDLDVTLHPDPMPALEEHKRDLAEHHIVGSDLTETQKKVLKVAVDGGQQHHEEVAEAADASSSTVYRLAEKLGDVLRLENGLLEVADEVVRDRCRDLLQVIERSADWVSRSIDQIRREADDVDLAEDSPLAKWMRTYGVSIDRGGYGRETWTVDIQVGRYRLDEIRRVLRAGYHAARATGAVVSDYFLESTFLWSDQEGEAQRREKAFTITPPQLRALGMPISDIA